MAIKLKHQSSSEIGVFACLTNTYCLVADSNNENFYLALDSELGSRIPVVKTTIGGSTTVGSCCVGNRKGLLVSNSTTEYELMNIRNALPDDIKIQRVEERLNALGNVIAVNDYVAFCHMDIDKETEQIIEDILDVEVYRTTVNNEVLVGQYMVFNNLGGVVHSDCQTAEIDFLSEICKIPLAPSTINKGSINLAAGILLNDYACFVGHDSTQVEIKLLERVFKSSQRNKQKLVEAIRPC
uniref:Eukaryotic translation initiation factor 6 n=1 Tax=Dermatophagoides pteronyssinus TaxID=6956 RepID=A0A6P6XLQ0_DERPT|nr:eukaryotic translation initiation factor 6-like [Dermatophagoides pteronyssinus]